MERMTQVYEPFGSLLPGRNYSSNAYRFGFNGQEKVDEMNGATGTHNTALFWEYDTRTGRRWNLDPKPTTGYSDYSVLGLNPIQQIDPDGDRWFDRATRQRAREMRQDFRGAIRYARQTNTGTLSDINEAKAGLRELRDLRRANDLVQMVVDPTASGAYFTMTVQGGSNVLTVVAPSAPAPPPGSAPAGGAPNLSGWTPDQNGYRSRSMAHELKHAHQYLKGKVSFSGGGTFLSVINGAMLATRPVGMLYDREDEVEAMRRGQVFDKLFWGASRPAQFNDIMLGVGSPGMYGRIPSIQLTSHTQMGSIDRQWSSLAPPLLPGFPLGLAPPLSGMRYQDYQRTLPVSEIFNGQ